MKYIRIVCLSFLLLLIPRQLPAQLQLTGHVESGEHNASEGMYLRAAGGAEYRLNETTVCGDLQFDLISNVPRRFSGLRLGVSRPLEVRDFPFELGAFFLHKPYSDLQYENNWGLLVRTDYRHVHVMLGNGFRAYRLTRQAVQDYPEDAGSVIRENWNLIYHIGYQLKTEEDPWNAGVFLSNMDRFLMNQETNPMLYVRGSARIVPDLRLFAEACYKQAGVFNISANYFGFFFRTGLRWEV